MASAQATAAAMMGLEARRGDWDVTVFISFVHRGGRTTQQLRVLTPQPA
jgi:hypothetical protein